jgi:integrase
MTISRSVEETIKHGRQTKEPKSERGNRTITLDDGLVSRLRVYRQQMLRLIAGVPDDAGDVDLSLVRLPPETLLFPGEPEPGDDIDLTKLRNTHSVTNIFVKHAGRAGFTMRFHDLRASHLALLLDQGIPVHVVAARAGHDAAVLLSNYAKWTKKADAKVAEAIANISKSKT